MLAGKLLIFQIFKNMGCISHKGDGWTDILSDLGRIHIDMYQYFILGNQIRLAHSPVRHPCAHHDQKIRLIHGAVGVRLAVVAHHAVIEGMLRRHDTDSHHGGYHGDPVLFGKRPQPVLGIAEQHAASRTDDGTLCAL